MTCSGLRSRCTQPTSCTRATHCSTRCATAFAMLAATAPVCSCTPPSDEPQESQLLVLVHALSWRDGAPSEADSAPLTPLAPLAPSAAPAT